MIYYSLLFEPLLCICTFRVRHLCCCVLSSGWYIAYARTNRSNIFIHFGWSFIFHSFISVEMAGATWRPSTPVDIEPVTWCSPVGLGKLRLHKLHMPTANTRQRTRQTIRSRSEESMHEVLQCIALLHTRIAVDRVCDVVQEKQHYYLDMCFPTWKTKIINKYEWVLLCHSHVCVCCVVCVCDE